MLINEKGDFYQIVRDGLRIVPVYLRIADANYQLEQFLKSNKGAKVSIAAYSLNRFFKEVVVLRKSVEAQGRKLEAPVVVPEEDMNKAREILQTQGFSDSEIKSGLRIPVFYAEPMVAAPDSTGRQRELFFMSFDQLQQATNLLTVERKSLLKFKVADLQVVLGFIQADEDDKYAFMQTKDFSRIREEFLKLKK